LRCDPYTLSCFFFFQAEDGIRDFHVTGVQTCALPIFNAFKDGRNEKLLQERLTWAAATALGKAILSHDTSGSLELLKKLFTHARSEERRVGKESNNCRRMFSYNKEYRIYISYFVALEY